METGCLCKGTRRPRLEETVDRVRQSFLGVSSSFQTNFQYFLCTGYLEKNKEKGTFFFCRYKRHVGARDSRDSHSFIGVSRLVVYKIGTEDLNFKKLCSLWVPRLLTVEHKEKRFAILLDFLIRYEEEGDDMLSRIVTRDEAWIFHIKAGIKATVDGMATHILFRQGQIQTNAVKAQDYGNSVLTQGLPLL
ncbi:uncharacterized protein TNCV_1860931 [Trichonephila clavipes]|nr:uncharacterized protein TNCV_1860931 [Trichonephila clavipes]